MYIHGGNVYDEETSTTKTSKNRTVLPNQMALDALLRQKAHTFLEGGYVFHDPKAGKPWKYRTIPEMNIQHIAERLAGSHLTSCTGAPCECGATTSANTGGVDHKRIETLVREYSNTPLFGDERTRKHVMADILSLVRPTASVAGDLYAALRDMHWTDKKLAVVKVKDLPLGIQTYSGDMLDAAILKHTANCEGGQS